MTPVDIAFLAIVGWKEDRGGGIPGMTAVMNVVCNRSARDHTSPYSECVKRLQFSSITAAGDPELIEWAEENDPQWVQAQSLAQQAAAGALADLTQGSTLYYCPGSITSPQTIAINGTTYRFPAGWDPAAVQFTVEIGSQLYFREV